MAVIVTCISVTIEQDPSTVLRVRWDDGSESEFTSKQQLKDYAGTADDDAELAKKIMLAKWIKTNPALTNTGLMVNHSCTLDVTASPIVRIT